MNQVAVIFTKGEIPVIGQRVTGLIFNDARFFNGQEIQSSEVASIAVLNNDISRYSALVVTKSGTKYMVYVKAMSA